MDGQNYSPDSTAEVEDGRWRAFAELADVRIPQVISALEAAVTALQERAEAADAKTAGALQKQLAATEGRFDAERKRAERAEKRADNDREALLNAESKTWRTLAALEAAHKQGKQLQAKLAEAEVAAETAIRLANALRQEDEARRARGLLSRLRAAWRGR